MRSLRPLKSNEDRASPEHQNYSAEMAFYHNIKIVGINEKRFLYGFQATLL